MLLHISIKQFKKTPALYSVGNAANEFRDDWEG